MMRSRLMRMRRLRKTRRKTRRIRVKSELIARSKRMMRNKNSRETKIRPLMMVKRT
jgi:hypothetical protein